jgi:hypothetical protein
VDETIFWYDLLTPSQIQELYNIRHDRIEVGLVGQWLLGEGSGSVAYDTSGNENHGAITDAEYAGGYVGAGLHFDGSGDYIEIVDDPALNFGMESFTVSFWIKYNLDDIDSAIEKSCSWDCGWRFAGDTAAGLQRFFIGDNTNYAYTEFTVPDESWHLVTGTVSGRERMDLYLDGVLIDSETSISSIGDIDVPDSLFIGSRGYVGGYNIEGFMDEIMTWDRALSSYEIYNLYTSSYDLHENEYYQSSYGSFAGVEDAYVNPTTVIALEAVYSDSISETYPGRAYMPDDTNASEYSDLGELAGLWLFDEGQGDLVGDSGPNANGGIITDAQKCPDHYEAINLDLVGLWCLDEGTGDPKDTSGNGNDGTISGASWTSSGYLGSGLDFDGVNDYVDLGDIDDVDGLTSITVSAWIKADATMGDTATGKIVSKDNVFVLGMWSGSGGMARFYIRDGSGWQQSGDSTTAINDGQWHHIIGMYDGVTIQIWVDGVLENSAGHAAATMQSNSNVVAIGAEPSGSPFKGGIDEVSIFDTALSAAEVLELYQLTDPGGMWTTGVQGTGLEFDGAGDMVELDVSNMPKFHDQSLSVAAWVQVVDNDLDNYYPFFWLGDPNAGGDPYLTITKSRGGYAQGRIYVEMYDSTEGTSGRAQCLDDGPSIPLNTWIHIVGVIDDESGEVRIYCNGVLEDTHTNYNGYDFSVISDADYMGRIGGNGYSHSYNWHMMKGQIDEVALYTEAFDGDDALALYTMSQSRFQSGQMAYWPLDYGSPQAGENYDWLTVQTYECGGLGPDDCIFDHSNNDNTGRLGGGFDAFEPDWSPDCRFANNYCLDFDKGAGDYVDVGPIELDMMGSWTVSMWFTIGPDQTNGLALHRAATTSNSYIQPHSSGDVYFEPEEDALNSCRATYPAVVDTWYHFVVTVEDNVCVMYVDGVDTTAFMGLTVPSTFYVERMGGTGSKNFDGRLDEVMIWDNRALTPTEVSELYESTDADCIRYPLTCNPKPQSGHLTRFQVWGSNTNDFSTATLEAEWTEGSQYYMSSEGGRNILSLAAEVPYMRFWWWTVNMSNEHQSTPILHSVMLEMELFTQPYTLVPNPLSDPDLCWSNQYDTPGNDDLHEFYLDPNSATYGRHYLNFKCPIYPGRDVNADSLSDDGYIFIFNAGSGKVNATWEVWLSQSSRGLDFMKSWVNVYDIDKLWMNDTLPLSMGSDLFFTRGMNHGITGWEVDDPVDKYDRMVGIEFYSELPEAFSADDDDELTFHIPFETPNDRICCMLGSPYEGVRYVAEVSGYTSNMLLTGTTTSIGSNYLVDDTLLISGMDGVGVDGLWDDTDVLDGATILRFKIAFEWSDQDYGGDIRFDEVIYYTHDANSDFDMGEDANFFNKHNQLGCDVILSSFVGCEIKQHIDFAPVHHVSVGPDFWRELTTGLPNNAPVLGPKYLYNSNLHQIEQPTIVCTFIIGCVASTQVTEYELEFIDAMAEYEQAAIECGEDAGWGEDNDLSSAAISSCAKFLVVDSGRFALKGVEFYGNNNDWATEAYQSQLDDGSDIAGMVTFKQLYALLNFQDGTMWEAAWMVGSFAEGIITVVVTVLQDNIGMVSDFLVAMTRFMVFLFIMGSIVGSTRVINNSLHGRWELVNYNCATGLTQAAGFMSVIPFVGGGMANVTRGAVANLNKYRPNLKQNKRTRGYRKK